MNTVHAREIELVSIHAEAFGKVAVLMGGHSAEREISLLSGGGVLAALKRKGVNAQGFDTGSRDFAELKHEGFDRAFIALHGRLGEDGSVQGALELLGIPYTGSGVLASSLAMDKLMTKRIWVAEGLSTPAWKEVHSSEETRSAFQVLKSPMVVKPAREGSTIGLTKVLTVDQCEVAYAHASARDTKVMCEQYIAGDEVTVTVLGQGDSAQALPVVRIVAPEGNYDYNNKYFTDDTLYIVPSGLPDSEEASIKELALRAFHTIGCRGWARVDLMIDASTREPQLLEINTAPGMTSHSLTPLAAGAVGLTYDDLCLIVLRTACLDHS